MEVHERPQEQTAKGERRKVGAGCRLYSIRSQRAIPSSVSLSTFHAGKDGHEEKSSRCDGNAEWTSINFGVPQ